MEMDATEEKHMGEAREAWARLGRFAATGTKGAAKAVAGRDASDEWAECQRLADAGADSAGEPPDSPLRTR